VLGVVQADERSISLYDVRHYSHDALSSGSASLATSTTTLVQAPVYSRQTSSPVLALSWQPTSALEATTHTADTDTDWSVDMLDHSLPNRLMVATKNGFEEISLHEYKPLCVSKRGELLVGCGKVRMGQLGCSTPPI